MLQPLGKRVLIQPIIPEKKTSVLILKEDIPQSYKVLVIGDETTKVKVGDEIYIATYGASDIKHNTETFQIVSEENIIAKIM